MKPELVNLGAKNKMRSLALRMYVGAPLVLITPRQIRNKRGGEAHAAKQRETVNKLHVKPDKEELTTEDLVAIAPFMPRD